MRISRLIFLLIAVPLVPPVHLIRADQIEEALQRIQSGRYEEGLTLLEQLNQGEESPRAVRLKARALAETGQVDRAIQILAEATEKVEDQAWAPLAADLADLYLRSGQLPRAVKTAERGQQLDPDSAQVQWARYRSLRAVGRYDDADRVLSEAYVLVTHRRIQDPWELLAAGQILQEFASRHLRDADQATLLNSVLNDYYDGAFSQLPQLWQARYLSGRLFVAKYRSADADRDLQQALLINPSAVPVYVALGELALNDFQLDQALQHAESAIELVPDDPDALALKAAVFLARAQTTQAVEWAKKALASNPAHWKAAAILATASYVEGDHAAYEQTLKDMARLNPHPVEFFLHLGLHLEDQRVFPEAERWFKKALETDAAFNPPRAALGMLLMRVAREEEARPLLEEAFSRDPYSVRIKNTLEVLDLLDQYTEFRGEHVRIKVDREKDNVLGMAARWYLERIWNELTGRFGYSPREPALIEIFNEAKGHTGHQWFSARTIGLPWIGTVGACTGKVVAMVSPLAMRRPFNWGRVVRHELTHVITLQQTDFNITHWFTEALAVDAEGFPRPRLWDEVLLEAHRSNELLDLSNINAAFIRPGSQARWALAYCQAKLYLDYMRERFGSDAAAKLLASYAAGHRDPRSVEVAFGVPLADFEAGYKRFIDALVDSIKNRYPDRPLPFAELEKKVLENPQDARLKARLALAYLQRRGYRRARDLAGEALRLNPDEPLALYVLARLYLQIGEDERAEELLNRAVNPNHPEPNALALAADRAVRKRDFERARELYELGMRAFPADQRWVAGLARVALLTNDTEQLAFALERLALADPDDLTSRVKLAQLAEQAGNWKELERWGWEVVLVHPAQAQGYLWIKKAAEHLNELADAAEAARVLAEVDQERRADHLAEAARLFHRAGLKDRAREAYNVLQETDPGYPDLQALEKLLGEE